MSEQELTNEQLLAELEQTRQKLKAANDEAASYRVKNKELTEQFDSQQASTTALKQSLVQRQIHDELVAQGVTNAKFASMIDKDQLEFDDQGNATNLVETVTQFKTNFPEAADAKRRAPKVDASDKQPSAKPLTSAQKLLQQTG